jgi:hypothetical protein
MQLPSTAAPSAAPTIFLVNQFSGHGHLDLYARLYSACLLDLGYRVVLIAQQESGVCEWIAENCKQRCDDFFFFSRGELKPAFTGLLSSRIGRVWQEEGVRSLLLKIVRRGLRQALRPIEIAASALGPRFSGALRRVGRSLAHSSGVGLKPLVDEINTAEGRLGMRPDLVFFLYLDAINDDRRGCRYLAQYLHAPWAGIQFDPRCSDDDGSGRSECIFRCSNARGAAFLDPYCVPKYERTFPALHFGCLPDVTDASILPADSPLVARLRSAAGGRTIVLQLGTLGPHKGILQLIDVIRRADPSRFFFAIVGEVFWRTFGPDERELRRFAENPPEHCLVQAGYLEDERELNSIIAAADILFAVYRDFRQSSNTLTKAATFKKPVVVSDQHMMGKRVNQYDLGATVRFGNVDDTLLALELLRRRKRDEFGFSAYRRDHSVEALKINLATLLKLWLQAPLPAG